MYAELRPPFPPVSQSTIKRLCGPHTGMMSPQHGPQQALTSLMLVWTSARSMLWEGKLAVARKIASLSGAFWSCFFYTEK